MGILERAMETCGNYYSGFRVLGFRVQDRKRVQKV